MSQTRRWRYLTAVMSCLFAMSLRSVYQTSRRKLPKKSPWRKSYNHKNLRFFMVMTKVAQQKTLQWSTTQKGVEEEDKVVHSHQRGEEIVLKLLRERNRSCRECNPRVLSKDFVMHHQTHLVTWWKVKPKYHFKKLIRHLQFQLQSQSNLNNSKANRF